MFINPKVAIENGWIKGITDPAKQVQPNAIDFTVDKMMVLDRWYTARVSESYKAMRSLAEVSLRPDAEEPYWYLEQSHVYDGMSNMYVEVPEGVAAILYIRSTFARNGVLLASGLYDSGFKGHIGFTIYPHGGDIEIVPGTRIGQIAFVHADAHAVYAGEYNHEQGTHYAEERAAAHGQSSLSQPATPTPTLLEPPIAGKAQKSELAKGLEETNRWTSEQSGKPAGTKSFI
jgi:deoxycytidine triphosphate deaminase